MFEKLIKWNWTGSLVTTSLTVQVLKNENFVAGAAWAVICSALGLIVSIPLLFIVKFFFKIQLKWYYWFNCSTIFGYVIAVFLATRVTHLT